MARITVEDCLGFVKNRFDLVLLSSKRARQLEELPVNSFVEPGQHKPTVVALREIAEGKMSYAVLDDVQRSITGRHEDEDTE